MSAAGALVGGPGGRGQEPVAAERQGGRVRQALAGRAALYGGIAIVSGWILVAILAPVIANHNPRIPVGPSLSPPGRFLFGTDSLGFDVFSRVIYAPRTDLYLAAAGTLLAVAVGSLVGVAIGSARGLLGNAPMRLFDAIQAFPLLVLALALVGALGEGPLSIIIAIAFINLPIFVRIVRGQVLSLRELRYVEAAVADGNPRWRILVRHILPGTVSPVLAQATISIAYAVIIIAALSFLSVGLKPPTPEWGAMLQAGTQDIQSGQWWTTIFPGAALATLVLGFVLLGEGLQDVLDVERRT